MGTSSAYGGSGGGTPLVPSWLEGDGGAGDGSDAGSPDSPDTPLPPQMPAAPPDRPPLQSPPPEDRFTAARSNFSGFARLGGNNRASLGRAISHYVSRSTGGLRQAAQRMGSSRRVGARLLGFLADAQARGAQEALRALKLESLAGRPIEEIFLGLADYICPEGGTVDEGIARDAFIETIADLASLGVTDLDALTADQMQTVFELYATHAIETRICNDIGTKKVMSRLNLVVSEKRLDHGIGQAIAHLKTLGVFPSELGLDLLVLAAHVYAADTRISRASESQDAWTREIRLVVPVSDAARWTAALPILKRALDFLTGDLCTLGFRPRPKAFTSIVPPRPARLTGPSFDGVSLFSGGLDSLIGAIDIFESGNAPLLVSHAGEGAVSRSQQACFNALKMHYRGSAADRLRVWMNFDSELVKNVGSEATTRSRSFLFFALGVFAGTGLNGSFTLRIPENGLIALNVPLDPLRLGALSTRTTHPFYMARWNDLLVALGVPGRIENPYWDKTKGEMVAGCANGVLLQRVAPDSLSCSSPTKGRWQKRRAGHCGYCLPCLIRRAALGTADRTIYAVTDLRAHALDTRRAEGQQIRSFRLAIERLRERADLAKLLIHKSGPLTDEPGRFGALAGVYRRGLEEVGRLLAGVQARPG